MGVRVAARKAINNSASYRHLGRLAMKGRETRLQPKNPKSSVMTGPKMARVTIIAVSEDTIRNWENNRCPSVALLPGVIMISEEPAVKRSALRNGLRARTSGSSFRHLSGLEREYFH
jgi:hypothetical protein